LIPKNLSPLSQTPLSFISPCSAPGVISSDVVTKRARRGAQQWCRSSQACADCASLSAVERPGPPGPFAKGPARLARRAGGARQPRPRGPRQSPGALPAPHFPFGGKEKKGRRLTRGRKEYGRWRLSISPPPVEAMSAIIKTWSAVRMLFNKRGGHHE
jgi:hypothetical protein